MSDKNIKIHKGCSQSEGDFRLGSGGGWEAKGRKYSLANWKTSSGFLRSKNCKKSEIRARISGCCLRYEA